MKLLIGYDGSAEADSALDDLGRAGLPDEIEAVVLTVAEIWLPSPNESKQDFSAHVCAQSSEVECQQSRKAFSEAKTLSKHAQKRLSGCFPNWKIESRIAEGSPAQEIIREANRLKTDLIVVGFSGRGGFFSLGSVSQKILYEAGCSVRIARQHAAFVTTPLIIIGYDGSPGAEAAVEAVAARRWREGTEVCLIAVADQTAPASIERFVAPIERLTQIEPRAESLWIDKASRPALEKLRAAGLAASLDIRSGNPKQVLVEQALRRGAEGIFTGAKRFASCFDQFLLGSVSAAVAARAACPVEVVREQRKP